MARWSVGACGGSNGGWRKRQCDACGRKYKLVRKVLVALSLVNRWGESRRTFEPGSLVCLSCLSRNAATLHAAAMLRETLTVELGPAVDEHTCDRCGGVGVVWDRQAERLVDVGSSAVSDKSVRGRERKCPQCQGRRTVPA